MSHPLRALANHRPDRLRLLFGRRTASIFLALLVQVLVLLALLTLGVPGLRQDPPVALVSFDSRSAADQPSATPEAEPQDTVQDVRPVPQPPQQPPQAEASTPQLILIPREQMQAFDITALPSREPAPAAPNRSQMGPVDTQAQPDTARVGTAPNGEPLYAASWYREPYDNELRGYLSTATGPGWGLIACRTVPDYRVEDCVGLGEHPTGSNIMRSVLAAAWQFRVRPPRLGGRPMVGEWVRIRIDYTVDR